MSRISKILEKKVNEVRTGSVATALVVTLNDLLKLNNSFYDNAFLHQERDTVVVNIESNNKKLNSKDFDKIWDFVRAHEKEILAEYPEAFIVEINKIR